MFREKRSDTLVRSIETTYGIDLKARGDMELGSFLKSRGYTSLSEFLRAYRGRLSSHPCRRNAFLSFHSDDVKQVQGFRLMFHNEYLKLDIDDSSSRRAVRSADEVYIRSALKERIRHSDVVICLIGNGTAWREWVDWELATAVSNKVPICGVRLSGARGRRPPLLSDLRAPISTWVSKEFTQTIEQAIARGT